MGFKLYLFGATPESLTRLRDQADFRPDDLIACENGAALEALLQADEPILLLVDLSLSGASGLAVLPPLAKRGNCFFVVLVAKSDEALGMEALELGALDYFCESPAQLRRLHARIAKLRLLLDVKQERELAFNALAVSEQRFRTLVENIPGLVLRRHHAFPWPVSFISQGARKMLGRGASAFFGPKPVLWSEVVLPEDHDSLRTILERAPERADTYELEYRVRSVDGRIRYVVERGTLERDAAGDILGVDAVLMDVSDQRAAEQAMRESEERLRLAMEATSDGLWDWDLSQDSVYWSARSYTMLSYRPAEFTLNFEIWQALVHPEDVVTFTERLWQGLKQEGAFSLDYRLRNRDGSWRWMNCRGKAVQWDAMRRILRVAGTHSDINARVEAERSLQETNRRLELLFEEANDAIFIADTQTGELISANARAAQLIGCSREELIGLHQAKLHPPAERDKYRLYFQQAIDGVLPVKRLEVIRKDGVVVPVDVSVSLVQLPNGKRVLQGIFRDLSEHAQLELELRQAQKMEAIGRLAGGVAHDFNNVLAAIMLQLSMLQADRRLPPDIHSTLTLLESSTKRAADITRQLLLFGRRQPAKMQALDLDLLLSHFLKMLRRLIGENIRLQFEARPGQHWVMADPGMIEQVVMNLVVNSRDALAHKGGTIWMDTEIVDGESSFLKGRLGELSATRPYVVLRVRDDGAGMDESVLKRIFEPFFTTKQLGKGTGLGLATAYSIVRQHGGLIFAESQEGQGACFTVCLPRGEAAPAKPTAGVEKGLPKPGNGVVLLVEDDNIVRTFTHLSLRAAGYTVIEARDGQEAIKAWDTLGTPVDILLTDLVMPNGVDGWGLISRFRTASPQLAVVLMSGYTAAVPKTVHERQNRVIFLQKPFDASRLGQALQSAVTMARSSLA